LPAVEKEGVTRLETLLERFAPMHDQLDAGTPE
jgi:hypothetical protein